MPASCGVLLPAPCITIFELAIVNVLVTLKVPTGILTVPPFIEATYVIAACIAAVSSVTPSPTAPKSLTETISFNLDATVRVTAPVPVAL